SHFTSMLVMLASRRSEGPMHLELLTLLALAVGASPASPDLDKSSPARGSLSGVFAVDDYPADALDLNQQGSVGVLLRVDSKGAVSDCVITASSGSPALDAQTCRVAGLRAKFIPAREQSGAPVASTYGQRTERHLAGE